MPSPPPRPNSTGTSTGVGGSPWASFMLGVPNGNVTLRNVSIPYYYRWNSGAAFIQDDWKVTPSLTLNIGLRYALQMPRTEKYNNQGVFRPGPGAIRPARHAAEARRWQYPELGPKRSVRFQPGWAATRAT